MPTPFLTSKLFDLNIQIPEGIDLTINQGGTSSGKTYCIMQALFIVGYMNPGTVITVIGQDIPNLKAGAIRDAQSIFESSEFCHQIISHYNKSDRIYHFLNGSIIEFKSYENEQDAKSGKRDFSFFNEVNGISYEVFEAIYSRTKVHTWVDFNPSSTFWLTDRRFESRVGVRTIKSTYEHNPFLDESLVKKIQAYEPTAENIESGTANEYRWKVYGLGEYAPLEGAIFNRWKRGTFDESLPYGFGLDWGTRDPFALMKVAIDSKKRIIYVKQICYQEGLAMSNIKKIMARNVTDELVVADSADLRGRIDLMEDGYNIFPAHKQGIGGIVSRIRAIMDYLIIIEDSPDVERELINYVWIDKRGEIPIDKFNHALDAMAYYFTHIRLQGIT